MDRQFLGATLQADGSCEFVVWAPRAMRVDVHLFSPRNEIVALAGDEAGYFRGTVDSVSAGARYKFRLDGDAAREFPDPASRSQPDGVHDASAVVPRNDFPWTDSAWRNHALRDYVLVEMHVGTYTRDGNFSAATHHLKRLHDLGITAIEIMPVAQFPGSRNWGYDGVYPFAVQHSYGGVHGLKEFVNAAHHAGLAVVLDVVYNHLGPEGNYLSQFAPYFTDRYHTPWGEAVNFDDARCDEVRRYFIENALQWVEEFHIDALRLDAVHAIFDQSAYPFLEELATTVHARAEELGRRVYIIAESDLNDPKLVRDRAIGGFGLDGMWVDDLHHSLHAIVTGERGGYYADFGAIEHLARAWNTGASVAGHFSTYRRRTHGRPFTGISPHQIIVGAQNHDQVGNRLLGDRLSTLVNFESQKLAAGITLLAPFVPLLFMGEEYGETAPFQYFISHTDPDLVAAVRAGRKAEFESFAWDADPPDPQAETTMQQCVLNHELRLEGPHRVLYALTEELLRLRREHRGLHHDAFGFEEPQVLFVRIGNDDVHACAVFHFGETTDTVALPIPPGEWSKVIDSADKRWNGGHTTLPDTIDSRGNANLQLAPLSFALFRRP